MPRPSAAPAHFNSAAELRIWYERNHATAPELLLRLRKVGTGGPGVTYAEALDAALCFGWIDGVRGSLDQSWFTTRFTPRKPRSIWSKINLGHVERLEKEGLMHEAGRAAFARRDPRLTGIYSFENPPQKFPQAYERLFRGKIRAWKFFAEQPPGYRRTATHWVMRAKQESTRRRRLEQLIVDSAAGRRLAMLTRPARVTPRLRARG